MAGNEQSVLTVEQQQSIELERAKQWLEVERRDADLRLSAKRDFLKTGNIATTNVLKQNEQLLSMAASRIRTGNSDSAASPATGEGGDVNPEKLGKLLDTLPYATTINITEYNGAPNPYAAQPSLPLPPAVAAISPTAPPTVPTLPAAVAAELPKATQLVPPVATATGQSGTAPAGREPWYKNSLLTAGLAVATTLGGVGLGSYLNRPANTPPTTTTNPGQYEATLEWEIEGGEVNTHVNATSESAAGASSKK